VYKTLTLTLLALLAFAGNSVLCRLALGEQAIDATSFTAIRLLSGIFILVILWAITARQPAETKGSWKAAGYLFVYAIAFSFAYLSLDTGTGALVLFGAVQITMITASLVNGNRLQPLEWCGALLAFGGFLYLVLPNVTTPSIIGYCLMAAAGIAWAFYTLAGKGSNNPFTDTTFNFLRTLPLVLLLGVVIIWLGGNASLKGVMLALLSGGITSGIGYAIWYQALRDLSALQAAVVQLLVPVIAAAGGVVFSDEQISLRLVLAGALVLGGILMVIIAKRR
jgi:drug/metabolite transporter (DMT)-like permease